MELIEEMNVSPRLRLEILLTWYRSRKTHLPPRIEITVPDTNGYAIGSCHRELLTGADG